MELVALKALKIRRLDTAGKPTKAEPRYRTVKRGDALPEAAHWPNLRVWMEAGQVGHSEQFPTPAPPPTTAPPAARPRAAPPPPAAPPPMPTPPAAPPPMRSPPPPAAFPEHAAAQPPPRPKPPAARKVSRPV